ncbi:Asp-tRNA(Asn)/Glu-tRNA(Gln) amidotransferase subunit GatC [Clostridium kluyveri]|uniref:Aspartyl/glutamyl-tRNA(Asn/Gln) amidotransferase subunit C n=1 Tax=Clostridium kluyveri TaxID=1534 RepID=A0A1L5FCR8_CLOKL|nr:Asp-tRNA(Asn)/Glu-tRNA(Gln) amidotransferase subunit GatC [Clostridium kluyveri]APM40767.1 asparaginyl/glutamyl-tRNA amidotransferase subunit C [Clostridium kluyveri]UZQ49066.1 Asp-tRNA(Asn)/Glu-tRNA(Gln) amidotransferase subunit GatC [Clostridium kluyveri]
MTITIKDVEYVSNLARLEFEEEEKVKLVKDLNKILEYMEKLDELHTEEENIIVNPYYMENKFREDILEPSLDIQWVLDNSPDNFQEYIVVPKVVK